MTSACIRSGGDHDATTSPDESFMNYHFTRNSYLLQQYSVKGLMAKINVTERFARTILKESEVIQVLL